MPLEYTVPAKELKEGKINIVLEVTDDNNAAAKSEVEIIIQNQELAPDCKITEPVDGSVLNVFEPILVKAEGSGGSDEIKEVIFSVKGRTITEVTHLPFEYTIQPEQLEVGELTIMLMVENTAGRFARDEVTITLEDQNIPPVCQITSPQDGDVVEMEDTLIIKGEGSDEDGEIVSFKLKLNGVEANISTLPFEYTVPEDQLKPGELTITLEVTDNWGGTGTDEITITVLGHERTFTDTRDGKVYKTVKIGQQEWFAENCAWMPQVMSGTQGMRGDEWENVPCYYVYDYFGNDLNEARSLDNYKNHGVLYNFHAVIGSSDVGDAAPWDAIPSGIQGPCPDGWHVPSRWEWAILFDYVWTQIPDERAVDWNDKNGACNKENTPGERKSKYVLGALRSTTGWGTANEPDEAFVEIGTDLNGTDVYGFGLKPAGVRYPANGSEFVYLTGSLRYYIVWTPDVNYYYPASPGGSTINFSGTYYEPEFGRGGTDYKRAHSLRCLKN